jgi:predicted HTH transcriptional regulator
MANAEGGLIIYGVTEDKGFPIELCGFDVSDTDDLTLKLENGIRDNITPRMIYECKFIKCEQSYILLFRIPKGNSAPHMVTKGQAFYIRNMGGKHKMDISEIRNSFLTSAGYSKEAYLFHLMDEYEYNKLLLEHLLGYMKENIPLLEALDPINVGSQHIRVEAWNSVVRAGILPLLLPENQQSIKKLTKA